MRLNKYAIIIAIVLSACATPNDRRQGVPDINMQSNKTSKEVALCIADKWENTRPLLVFSSPPVNTNIRANGYSVAATMTNQFGSTNTIALVDILDYQQGSFIKYYKMGGGGYGDYDKAVMICL